MSLKHQFMIVESNLIISGDEDIIEHIENNDYNITNKIVIDDEILQSLLFDSNGNARKGISFNEWGITIIERIEQEKWIDVVNTRNIEIYGDKTNEVDSLKNLFLDAYKHNYTIIHLGILFFSSFAIWIFL